MSEYKAKIDLEARVNEFNTGYKALVEKTQIGLQAIITPTGPVLQKVDIKPAEEAKEENKTEEATK